MTPEFEEQLGKGIFASGKDVVLFFDRQGRLLDLWSPEADESPGRGKQMSGKPLQELFPGDIAQLHVKHLNRVVETGTNQVYCYEMESAPGETSEWEVQMVTVPGSQPSICCILKNVTGERRIMQAVEQKEQQVKTMMKFTLEREDRMIQLKQEINQLRKSLGKQPKYVSYTFDHSNRKE